MSQINAKKHELKNVAKLHFSKYESNASSSTKSEKLLLFYSIECGLKYLILEQNKKNTTNDFQNILDSEGKSLKDISHNIERMLRILKVESIKLPKLPTKMKDDKGNIIIAESSKYNQVWRYGIQCDEEIELKIEKALNKVMKHIKNRMENRV